MIILQVLQLMIFLLFTYFLIYYLNETRVLLLIKSHFCYSATISITRLFIFFPVNICIPTFIRYSPEKSCSFSLREEWTPGIMLISLTRYMWFVSNPCKRTGCIFSAYRGKRSKANSTARVLFLETYIVEVWSLSYGETKRYWSPSSTISFNLL